MAKPIEWLLSGDVSLQYLTRRDYLGSDEHQLTSLQNRIAGEGFGARFLSCQNPDGHWGRYYYQPKWTSTHYTLQDLKNLGVPATLQPCRTMVLRLLADCQLAAGGLNLARYPHPGDICVDGMVLDYAAYFCPDEPRLAMLAQHLLAAQKPDGGFTWDLNAHTGDPHTTICVLEGLLQYRPWCERSLSEHIRETQARAVAFLLDNRLFLDHADTRFRKLSYPFRYRYDLLRALACLAKDRLPRDNRLEPAVAWLLAKRSADGLWKLENRHKGAVHFDMEAVGAPSRFITLQALCAIRYFAPERLGKEEV
ncbi:MAG: hypothetical protein GX112_09285 [Clostridiaceae bacterium]|jgi:hypothetical protein|nr:hypothetical protein [Clostridiaceae bacterium]